MSGDVHVIPLSVVIHVYSILQSGRFFEARHAPIIHKKKEKRKIPEPTMPIKDMPVGSGVLALFYDAPWAGAI
jgi:hypothetical protein